MGAAEAEHHHRAQIETFRDTEADMVSALTITYADEAIGFVHAVQACGMPAVISFTVETDGKLPSGEALPAAIERVDLATSDGPAYYMVNCAQWFRVARRLQQIGSVLQREDRIVSRKRGISYPTAILSSISFCRSHFTFRNRGRAAATFGTTAAITDTSAAVRLCSSAIADSASAIAAVSLKARIAPSSRTHRPSTITDYTASGAAC